ncbi:MAG: methylmalonyl-CoA mutase, partial [Bradyrhizobium sp.]|nr:methylmalonyl-CoA mutase [Bradyrhizobium sp.]
MTSETDDLPLAADFAGATSADWRRLVDGVLKGAPFEKLVSKTYDGLSIEPIYPRAKVASPVPGRAAASPWQIMQRMDHPDPAKANAQALHDLENGATGLDIEFARGWHSRGFGLIDGSAETLKRAFEGVAFDAGISIALNPASWHGDNAGVNLAGLIAESGIDPGRLDLRF